MRDALFACVAALEREGRAHARGDVEVIVVDSSADGTAEALAAAFPSVTVLARAERMNAAAARNAGARMARAPLVAFVDADCTVQPGFVDAALTSHRAHAGAPVGGAVLPAGDEGASGFILFVIEFSGQLPRRAGRAAPVPFVPTCNLVVARDALLEAGGFPEEHARSHDLAFCARWRAAGRAAPIFDPTLRVVHHGPRGPRAVARHLFVLGSASARVRKLEREGAASLTGRALAASPWRAAMAAPLLVGWRACAVFARAARAEHAASHCARLAVLTPLLLTGLGVWAGGFVVGAASRR